MLWTNSLWPNHLNLECHLKLLSNDCHWMCNLNQWVVNWRFPLNRLTLTRSFESFSHKPETNSDWIILISELLTRNCHRIIWIYESLSRNWHRIIWIYESLSRNWHWMIWIYESLSWHWLSQDPLKVSWIIWVSELLTGNSPWPYSLNQWIINKKLTLDHLTLWTIKWRLNLTRFFEIKLDLLNQWVINWKLSFTESFETSE